VKSIMFRRGNSTSETSRKGIKSGSCSTPSSSSDEFVDFQCKGKKISQKESDSQTGASDSPMNTSDEESVRKSDLWA